MASTNPITISRAPRDSEQSPPRDRSQASLSDDERRGVGTTIYVAGTRLLIDDVLASRVVSRRHNIAGNVLAVVIGTFYLMVALTVVVTSIGSLASYEGSIEAILFASIGICFMAIGGLTWPSCVYELWLTTTDGERLAFHADDKSRVHVLASTINAMVTA